MKVNDSGMPDEAYWNSLFNIDLIVDWLDLSSISGPIVEIGCGYGTFTVPIAKKIKSKLISFDIEPEMIASTRANLSKSGLENVELICRDVIENKTGIENGIAGMVLMFNILHFPERRILLEEANRILQKSGILAIIHWRKDIPTPRGPNVELRPDQKTILTSVKELSLRQTDQVKILEPFHWGMKLIKENRGLT